jgi:serine protease AprX
MRRRCPLVFVTGLLLVQAFSSAPAAQSQPSWLPKLGPVVQRRLPLVLDRSRIVITGRGDAPIGNLVALVQLNGGSVRRTLPIINAVVADVPNPSIGAIAADAIVQHVAVDRAVAGSMERTGATIGATAVRRDLGYDGTGIGVAVIDSGVGAGLDDMAGANRVAQFVDFVNAYTSAYDDYGHGSHVAGIIAGSGFDSDGARSGIAPGASLVVLKVLDQSGAGHISDVIAALDYAVAHKDEFNIRIINLSVAAAVDESYVVDPLAQAAQRAVNAGIVVVAAAGNNGRSADGHRQYGGITSPGNAPWVVTVGASSHMGTVDRSDDTIAPFSSRGPSPVDYNAKPDLVAPGVGIESLSNPASTLYSTMSPYLLPGTEPTAYLPYLSLSGTSMSTPVVAGTVALMLQANPSLTPNEVKAILQFTAQVYAGYDRLTQGSGFLNAKGAVELSQFLASPDTAAYPDTTDWSEQIVWGNHLFHGGRFAANANAWPTTVPWGAAAASDGNTVVWGTVCTGQSCDDAASWTPWAYSANTSNVVWGTSCGFGDCSGTWTLGVGGSAVGTSDGDTVVWGTSDGDTVVWGTSDDGDTVVWGTSCNDPSCRPIIWPRP